MGKGPLQSAVLEECLLVSFFHAWQWYEYTSVRMQSLLVSRVNDLVGEECACWDLASDHK